uniref:Uncharacterized protein n=1 Tax=Arundo donax TaxID=35708 RepID=A0A0A9G126_ARUDO
MELHALRPFPFICAAKVIPFSLWLIPFNCLLMCMPMSRWAIARVWDEEIQHINWVLLPGQSGGKWIDSNPSVWSPSGHMCYVFGWACCCLCFMISSALILISCDIYVVPHV